MEENTFFDLCVRGGPKYERFKSVFESLGP